MACNIEENIHLHSALVFGSKPPNSWMWGLTGLVMPEEYFGHDGRALLKRDQRDRMALLKCKLKKGPWKRWATDEPPAEKPR